MHFESQRLQDADKKHAGKHQESEVALKMMHKNDMKAPSSSRTAKRKTVKHCKLLV